MGDGTSEEYILESRPNANNIVRTTDYEVSYQKGASEPEREMHEARFFLGVGESTVVA